MLWVRFIFIIFFKIHSSIDDLIKKPPTQSQLTHISDIINENDAGNVSSQLIFE